MTCVMEEEMFNTAYLVETLHEGGVDDNDQMDSSLLKTIEDASKGVMEGTDLEYR